MQRLLSKVGLGGAGGGSSSVNSSSSSGSEGRIRGLFGRGTKKLGRYFARRRKRFDDKLFDEKLRYMLATDRYDFDNHIELQTRQYNRMFSGVRGFTPRRMRTSYSDQEEYYRSFELLKFFAPEFRKNVTRVTLVETRDVARRYGVPRSDVTTALYRYFKDYEAWEVIHACLRDGKMVPSTKQAVADMAHEWDRSRGRNKLNDIRPISMRRVDAWVRRVDDELLTHRRRQRFN